MATGPANYLDGKTGTPQAVQVTLNDNVIAIASAGGAPLARWDVGAMELLPAPEDRLRLGLTDGSTARIEVRDPDFAHALREKLGFSIPHHTALESRRRRLVIAWTAAAAAAVLVIGITGLPALAGLLAPVIPYSWELRIGAQAHSLQFGEETSDKPKVCGDGGDAERAGKAVFLDLVKRMEAVASLPYPIKAFVIRQQGPNASALPGGYVDVHADLLSFVESSDEFAGVFAHELGHVFHRHSLKGALHRAGLAYVFGMALGDIFGSGAMILAASRYLDNRFSRRQEAEADAYAVQLMTRLGADPHKFADFFSRLMKYQRNHMLISARHPTDARRVAAVTSAPAVPNAKPILTEQEWRTLRQICSGK